MAHDDYAHDMHRAANRREAKAKPPAVEQAEPVEGVPCFDPGCPCCSVHTPLHEKYEDQIERLREALEKIRDSNFQMGRIWLKHIARDALGTQEHESKVERDAR